MKILQLNLQKSGKVLPVLLAFLVFTTACNKDDEMVIPQEDLPDIITALENFDEEVEYGEIARPEARWKKPSWKSNWKKKPTFFTLAAALKYTKLFSTVVRNRVTVFAPDDEAFAELGLYFWNINSLDKETLSEILLYHVTGGFVYARDLPQCSLDMLNGSAVGLNFTDGKVLIKDQTEDYAQVVFTDKKALNTVFHGVDKVLLPPDKTIAEIAVANGNFTVLVSLLQATGLDAVVADPSQNLTVFAPTDGAFAQLLADNPGIDLLAYFAKYPDELTKVLLHHVAAGSTFSFCLSDGQEVPTLNSDVLTVDLGMLELVSSSGNTVGLVTDPFLLDIHANNGVIHVIDYVLIPSNLDLTKPL